MSLVKNSILVIFFAVGVAQAKDISCKVKFPKIIDGCQGEGCSAFEYALLEKDLDLMKEIQSKEVIKKLKKGMKIQPPFSFSIVVKKPGKFRIEKEVETEKHLILKPGTTLQFVAYRGEGFYQLCNLEDIDDNFSNFDIAKELQPLQADEWIEVRLDDKVHGFLKFRDIKRVNPALGMKNE